MWRVILFLFLIVTATVVVLTTIPLKDEEYTVLERYQATETYWDKEEQPLKYSVLSATHNNNLSLSLGIYAEGFVVVLNTDTVPGTYDVDFSFRALRRTITDSVRLYLTPGESKTAHGIGDIDAGEDYNFSYSVEPGNKMVDVERTRTVWKEKPVIKTRKVPIIQFG